MERETVNKWVATRTLAALVVISVAAGAAGASAAHMYLRHNEQHRGTEQFQSEQRQFNQQLIAAIQQLSKQ